MLLHAWDNLMTAYRRAARGKRGLTDVAAFEYRLEDNVLALQDELRDRTYQPGAYRSFYVHEPKRRLISAAPFLDRVVHHALCALVEPALDRRLVNDTYANRIGRGTHRALDAAQHFSRRHRYVLQCDVQQFFPSIDHMVLRAVLARKVDPELLWLVDRILAGGAGVHGDRSNQVRGLPIGNLTSQLWANAYLSPVDHAIKRELRVPGYVRYVDDLLLFGDEKSALWYWHATIVERLADLHLTLHPGVHPRPVTEGFPFLGFTVYPDRRRLKRRKVVHFRRRLRDLIARSAETTRIAAVTRGWANHARYGNTVGLRAAVLGEARAS